MTPDIEEANARVAALAARIGRIETRLRSLPRLAWYRRRRLRARLIERQQQWLDAIEWQDIVQRYYGEEL